MDHFNRSESLYWEFMPLQGTEHWRSYIKTTCEIGFPVMLFIQVVHNAGSTCQVPEEGSDAHQGEAELQAGDGPATEPQERVGVSTEEEEGDGDTPFEARGEIDKGEVNEEVLRRYEMEADKDERGLEEDSSDDEDDPLVPRDWDSYNFSQQMVVGDVSDVCVIHDRHKGILQAINDIKEGSEERNRAAQWPDVHSRWCMRHMGANFHSQFKNKELTQLFKRLCSTNQEKKFYDLWQKLDDLTKKASEEIAKKPVSTEPGEEPVSLEDNLQPVDSE
jgi:hypothetical protein